jgi:hypothetical protein
MIIKHLEDLYLIYYVYTPSKINLSFYFTAISFVEISLLFLLYQMDFFLEIRGQTKPFALIFVAILIYIVYFLYFVTVKNVVKTMMKNKVMYKITK